MIKVCVTNFSLNNLKIVGSSTYFILKKRKMNSTFPCLSRINSWGKTEPRCRSRLTPIWCRRSFNILSHLKLEHCCEIIRLKNFVCIHESWCDVSRMAKRKSKFFNENVSMCLWKFLNIISKKKNDWKSLNQNYYLIQKCQKTICSDVCPDASIKEPRELKQQALEKLERVS